MLDLYMSAKYGQMSIAAFNGSAGAARTYQITLPTGRTRGLFAIRGTQAVRVLQGGSDVAAASATNATYLNMLGMFPLTVETNEDAYLSILGGSATAGNLEISLISDTSSWTLTEIV